MHYLKNKDTSLHAAEVQTNGINYCYFWTFCMFIASMQIENVPNKSPLKRSHRIDQLVRMCPSWSIDTGLPFLRLQGWLFLLFLLSRVCALSYHCYMESQSISQNIHNSCSNFYAGRVDKFVIFFLKSPWFPVSPVLSSTLELRVLLPRTWYEYELTGKYTVQYSYVIMDIKLEI